MIYFVLLGSIGLIVGMLVSNKLFDRELEVLHFKLKVLKLINDYSVSEDEFNSRLNVYQKISGSKLYWYFWKPLKIEEWYTREEIKQMKGQE